MNQLGVATNSARVVIAAMDKALATGRALETLKEEEG